jgi:hypothetical protein
VDDRASYPANFERVHDTLTKLWDLKTVQEVKAGPSQYGRLELAEPLAGAGTKIDFKDKDGKVLGALLLGKKHMKEGGGGFGGGDFAAGRYVMQPGGSLVSLVSETFDDIETKPESWLARDFIKISNPSAVTLAGSTDVQKWKVFTRECDRPMEARRRETRRQSGCWQSLLGWHRFLESLVCRCAGARCEAGGDGAR